MELEECAFFSLSFNESGKLKSAHAGITGTSSAFLIFQQLRPTPLNISPRNIYTNDRRRCISALKYTVCERRRRRRRSQRIGIFPSPLIHIYVHTHIHTSSNRDIDAYRFVRLSGFPPSPMRARLPILLSACSTVSVSLLLLLLSSSSPSAHAGATFGLL